MTEASTDFEAGRLRFFAHEWRNITRDPFVLDIVQHCHFEINSADVAHLFAGEPEYNFSMLEQHIVSMEIAKLLHLKVIKLTQREENQIVSPIFLRQKKNGEARVVLNLSELNNYIPYRHFKMENFEQAISLVNEGDFMASVDLRHAYYSVRIAEEQQKYFCFKWKGKFYQFTCLPNGVSAGPRLFTKLMKPVFAALREKGHRITSFIDDSLICHSSRQGCLDSIHDTLKLLRKLGFHINLEKSVLVPSQAIEYLGNIIDTRSMTVSLPERRIVKIRQACESLLIKRTEKIRVVARVTGLMVAATPAVTLGKLHYRNLEREKILALKHVQGNFDRKMEVTKDMTADLTWWVHNVASHNRLIFRGGTDIDLHTDASSTGWGGHLNELTSGGSWSIEEQHLHINALELKAVLLTLQAFSTELAHRHIRVFCDNTTAMTYINEMGGTKSLICNNIATAIWDWCLGHSAWVTCSFIPGKENIEADMASRQRNDRHEWKLNELIFRDLCHVFGTPSIDLFASRLNKQVNLFCSWRPDPEAAYFDAFSITWSRFPLCYMFPPFSLIPRCLQKLRAEKAEGWMVVPWWPSQPWMGLLLHMLVDHPRLIMRRHAVLTHPSSTEQHPVLEHTKLLACRLSGRLSENRAFVQRVQKLSWPLGSRGRPNNTDHTSIDGHTFVLGDTLIPFLPL